MNVKTGSYVIMHIYKDRVAICSTEGRYISKISKWMCMPAVMNQNNSPEHVYDHPDVVKTELQESSPVYYSTIKNGIDQSMPIKKSKTISEHKASNNCNKVTCTAAAVIMVTCINILLALCGLVAGVYAIVNLVELQVNLQADSVNDAEVAGTSGSVQMLFADVNATQYQLEILEEDVTRLVAVYNSNICLVPGE